MRGLVITLSILSFAAGVAALVLSHEPGFLRQLETDHFHCELAPLEVTHPNGRIAVELIAVYLIAVASSLLVRRPLIRGVTALAATICALSVMLLTAKEPDWSEASALAPCEEITSETAFRVWFRRAANSMVILSASVLVLTAIGSSVHRKPK